MLRGIEPDKMYDEPCLQGWNPDIADKQNVTWAYPPVLLLKAAGNWDGYKQRIAGSIRHFQRQVSPTCACRIIKAVRAAVSYPVSFPHGHRWESCLTVRTSAAANALVHTSGTHAVSPDWRHMLGHGGRPRRSQRSFIREIDISGACMHACMTDSLLWKKAGAFQAACSVCTRASRASHKPRPDH